MAKRVCLDGLCLPSSSLIQASGPRVRMADRRRDHVAFASSGAWAGTFLSASEWLPGSVGLRSSYQSARRYALGVVPTNFLNAAANDDGVW